MKKIFIILFALLSQAAFSQRLIVNGWKHVPTGSVEFVPSYSSFGTTRNDYGDFVGCKFTPSANMTITDLGRYVTSGNTGTHTMKITNSSNTTLASCTVNTSGITAGTFAYSSITPLVLTAGVSYYIFSLEAAGGDIWHDPSTPTTPSNGTIDGAYYIFSGSINLLSAGSICYVPLNFKYHL